MSYCWNSSDVLNIVLSYVEPINLHLFFLKHNLNFMTKFKYNAIHYRLDFGVIVTIFGSFPNIILTGLYFDYGDHNKKYHNLLSTRINLHHLIHIKTMSTEINDFLNLCTNVIIFEIDAQICPKNLHKCVKVRSIHITGVNRIFVGIEFEWFNVLEHVSINSATLYSQNSTTLYSQIFDELLKHPHLLTLKLNDCLWPTKIVCIRNKTLRYLKIVSCKSSLIDFIIEFDAPNLKTFIVMRSPVIEINGLDKCFRLRHINLVKCSPKLNTLDIMRIQKLRINKK